MAYNSSRRRIYTVEKGTPSVPKEAVGYLRSRIGGVRVFVRHRVRQLRGAVERSDLGAVGSRAVPRAPAIASSNRRFLMAPTASLRASGDAAVSSSAVRSSTLCLKLRVPRGSPLRAAVARAPIGFPLAS